MYMHPSREKKKKIFKKKTKSNFFAGDSLSLST